MAVPHRSQVPVRIDSKPAVSTRKSPTGQSQWHAPLLKAVGPVRNWPKSEMSQALNTAELPPCSFTSTDSSQTRPRVVRAISSAT